ncbi:MAG: family 20 glycosylhydrolase [Ignavibacteria bacterium]|jgi:hexosaminidase
MKIIFILLFMIMLYDPSSTFAQNEFTLIPYPASVTREAGSFMITDSTVIIVNDSSAYSSAEIFKEYIFRNYGIELSVELLSGAQNNFISLSDAVYDKAEPESYYLVITPNSINAVGDGAGLFHALQTIIQLLPLEKTDSIEVPCMEIRDYPRYKWRGMHLDVSRHFFPKEFIKRYIDFLALYKMNMFHWHLTDDQGWRIEIKKYPKLTEIGSWRNGTLIGHYSQFPHRYDSTRYGGYYTQDDIKEIVEYAEKRYITIVPEIEMPGHSLAALASYPEYSCTGGPFEVANEWGVFEDVYCPREETFKFLEDVLTEVMELFPGKYIHVGGDEVPKDSWKQCKDCQELMKKEGLKDENELESYFIRRIEKFINSKGRTMIGWDEILEGGLAPNAVVMSWRGTKGGIEAARQNHDVVMTPGGYCYFDHYQGNPKFEPIAIGGYTPVEKVYSFEPTPDSLTQEEQKHILGAQGNVWTEYIPAAGQVEYMVFPRVCALSEVLWSPKEQRNYDNFKKRLIQHFALLDKLGINYSRAIYEMKTSTGPLDTKNGISLTLGSDFTDGKIYYTIDGTEPTLSSFNYTSPIKITKNALIKAAYFENNVRKSNIIEQQFYINKVTGKSITLKDPPDNRYNYGGSFTLVDGIKGMIPWYGKEWLGFKGTDCDAVIDLGKTESFSKVSIDVLNDDGSWIYLPKKVELYISDDGINFTKVKDVQESEIAEMKREIEIEIGEVSARYVRIAAENFGMVPSGKPGEGHSAWLFVDEITIE